MPPSTEPDRIELRPIPDHPALLAGRALVVADLHIGIEEELREKGIRVPSRAMDMADAIRGLADRHGATRLVVLGDVKHLVPRMASRERGDVYRFFARVLERIPRVDVAPGNHDGLLRHILPRAVHFRSPYGFRIQDAGFCHGHAWPSKSVMQARTLVMGHNHPAVAFRDPLGARQILPCWWRLPFRRRHAHYPKLPREAIVVPAFNELCGGVPVNDVRATFLGPIFDNGLVIPNPSRIHLMDGTFLGRLADLRVDLRFRPDDYRQ